MVSFRLTPNHSCGTLILAMCLASSGVAGDVNSEPDSERGPEKQSTAQQSETEIGQLLSKLKQLQEARETGKRAWAETMRQLIEMGPDAVPELVNALDATPAQDRMMLRSIPFVLRGIGDKRAIPALIRVIPRCFGPDGSDMAYPCDDPELLLFMQKHDNSERDRPFAYTYGRPRNEVFRTLENWTGESVDWHQLAFVDARFGSPRQMQLKRHLFFENAHRWARWWQKRWSDFVDDPALSEVGLPPISNEQPLAHELDVTRPLSRSGRRSNLTIQSVYSGESDRAFYDLDTDRWLGLPEKWRNCSREKIESEMKAILRWASSQGFDLMGTEVGDPADRTYVIRPIDLQIWALPELYPRDASAQELIHVGESVDGLLRNEKADEAVSDDEYLGEYFFITNEGTPGLLQLGVQVVDSTRGPRAFSSSIKMDPQGRRLGRRFGLTRLQ